MLAIYDNYNSTCFNINSNNYITENNTKLTNIGKVIKIKGIHDDSMNIIKNPSSFDHFS